MQTLRKLPTMAPSTPATMTTSRSSITQHLVQKDSRRNRDVQGLGLLRQRDGEPGGGARLQFLPNPGAFIAYDERHPGASGSTILADVGARGIGEHEDGTRRLAPRGTLRVV